MEEFNFEEDLKISPMSLDEEWLKQAMLYFKWSEAKTQAMAERDDAKRKLELLRSKTELIVRKDPSQFSLEKATEGAIASTLNADEFIQEATKEYQNSVYNVNVLQDAIGALEHKRAALDNLTKLFLSGYYSSQPRESTANRTEIAHKQQEKDLNQNPRLQRLKRK